MDATIDLLRYISSKELDIEFYDRFKDILSEYFVITDKYNNISYNQLVDDIKEWENNFTNYRSLESILREKYNIQKIT